MENNLNIMIVSDEDTLMSQLKTIAETKTKNVIDVKSNEAIREMNREMAHIVIFVQTDNDTSVEVVQMLKIINSNALILFIANETDFTLLRNMTRAGVDEFFVFPDESSLFSSRFPNIVKSYSVKKASNEETVATTFGRGRGKIVTFYSGKGGSGCSLLASSFAQTMKLESAAEVILIDLNGQYGGVETLLSIESNRSLADLLPVIEELNESHIRNVAQTEEHSKMEVLISPCDPEILETLNDEFVAKLLRTCRRSFDYVVVDLPTAINELVVTAMEESDKIYYVLTPDTPSLKIMKQYEELSERLGLVLTSRMEIALNKLSKDYEVKQKDLLNVLRYPVIASIRQDTKGLQSYINQGQPVRKQTNERKMIPFAKDIRKFARQVAKQ
ncbi:AAA family ATPase [Sporosarcina sp. Sa2YVA2]|uniref:AAA family ATPase n=1 Tax=Sporosarcina quadrami TaxID=2762234 RepID=A0ABR8UB27_9BACL|nr:AAA family ATPase [Sporosarcina quadrami]MBD7984764.1 AAA family ATPase [Sporosarcina quadrami]